MKKLYFLIFSCFLLNADILAQCTPDRSFTEYGVHPSEIPNLCEGDNISQVLTVVAPDEVFAQNLNRTFYIDTVWIKTIENLPNGVSFNCENGGNTDCYMVTDQDLNYTCVSINGNSLDEFDGEVTITITAKARTDGFPATKIDSSYSIPLTVNNSSSAECLETSIRDLELTEESLSIYPNPVNANSSVFLNLNREEFAEVELYNIVGEKQANIFTGKLGAGNNQISLNSKVGNLPKGIYLLKVSLPQSNNSFMKRIIIQ